MASMMDLMQQYGGGPPLPTAEQKQPLRSTGMDDFETPTADPQMRQMMQERPQQAFPAADQSFDPQMRQMMQARQQQALMQQVRPGQIQPSMMGSLENPQNQLLPGEQLDPSRMGTGSGQSNRMTIARPPGGGGFMGPPPPGAGVRDDGRSANDLQRQLNRGGVSAGNTADVQSEINRLENERFAPLTPQPMRSPKLPGPLGGQPLDPPPVFESDPDDLSGDEVLRRPPLPSPPVYGGRKGVIGNSPFGTQLPQFNQAMQSLPQQGPIPQAAPTQMQGGYGLSNYQSDQFSKGVMSLPQIQDNFHTASGGYTAPALQSPWAALTGYV